jgi:aarF domain-containing kinase
VVSLTSRTHILSLAHYKSLHSDKREKESSIWTGRISTSDVPAAQTITTNTMFAARRALSRPALSLFVGTTTTATIGTTTYLNTDSALGLKREIDFWSSVTPVVFDYWWNFFESSPKVRWQKYMQSKSQDPQTTDNDVTDEEMQQLQKEQQKALLTELHTRNAPKIYQTMIQLGGLYIKLGQVLSVTALPIPELYREYFRTLQSNVPNHEDFEKYILPTLQEELGDVYKIFESIEEIPCGAASIGQAHKGILKETNEEVVIKVQYPNAVWQVPADIECVGDLLKVCVFFGVVDEDASRLSYDEFARQFLSELDYVNEMQNLKDIHASSLDPKAPYLANSVVLPHVYEDLCTERVITMSYLKGKKFEEETKRQLRLIGVDTKKSIHSMIKESGDLAENKETRPLALSSTTTSWKSKLSTMIGSFVSVDFVFSLVRLFRRIALWSQHSSVRAIQLAAAVMPSDWKAWADEMHIVMLQNNRLDWTEDAVNALLDVHGYQILNQGKQIYQC